MQKESKIKVSIIVPVYNVEDYIEKCLDSLINQTLDNYEVIVVNDGSPDNSQRIIDDYVLKFPSIVKSFVKENGGLSDARNFGVNHATGEYIGFVDSDDFVREDMFELMYNKGISEKSDVVVCDYYSLEHSGIKEKRIIKNIDDFNNSIESVPSLLFECKSYACTKIYRREWFIKNNFVFPVGQWYEDSAIIYNILFLANKVSCVNECLYFYRTDRVDSITNTVNKKIYDIFKSAKSILDFYRSRTNDSNILEVVERLCQVHIFIRLRALVRGNDKMETLNFYNTMMNFFDENIPNWKENKYYKSSKKRSLYLKIRPNRFLMYLYILFPKKVKKLLRKLLKFRKKKSKKSKSGNYISNERLRELQLIELEILKEVDKICKENNITYYLGEGTLLGAVRHNGFIPWDDDLDILMPRNDYERFIDLAVNQLNTKYRVLNDKTYENYYLPFTKIVSLIKYDFLNTVVKFDDEYCGPFIDIFPLDCVPEINYKKVESDYLKIRKIRDILLLKVKYFNTKSLKRKWLNFLGKFYTNRELEEKLYKEMTKYNSSNAKCMVNFASSYHPKKQIVKKEVYGKPKYLKFENNMFPVPSDYDTLLKTIYGDYMVMPPVKKRKSKHGFYDRISVENSWRTKPLEEEQIEKESLEEVRNLQLYELEILKEVDRVCRENDIKYYLGEGTLLGAVRHGGFIPWDDDVDIVMPRDDFERFLSICAEKLDANYKLQFYHNVKKYWVQSPKIRMLKDTEFKQKSLLKYTDDVGPYIDIFPLDYSSVSLSKLDKQYKYIRLYRRILFLKTGFSKKKKLIYKLLKFYSYFISVETIHKKIYKMSTKYKNKTYYTNFGSYYNVRKETFPVKMFDEPIYMKFEDSYFPVPSNYDYVLTNIYGNYMELPPKEKQKAKHSF